MTFQEALKVKGHEKMIVTLGFKLELLDRKFTGVRQRGGKPQKSTTCPQSH